MPAHSGGAATTRVAQVSAGRFRLAIDASLVEQAVTGPIALLPLPRVAPHVLGACEIRGAMIPVVDLAGVLDPGMSRARADVVGMVVLIRHRAGRFALPIDALHGMRTVPSTMLTRIDVQSAQGRGLFSVLVGPDGDDPASVLLDVEALLRVDDLHLALESGGTRRGAAVDDATTILTCLVIRVGTVSVAIPSVVVRQVSVRDVRDERAFAHPVLRGFRTVDGTPRAVVDLLALLELRPPERTDGGGHLLSVAAPDGEPVDLIVDALLAIERIALATLQPPPDLVLPEPLLCRGSVLHARHGMLLVLDAAALVRAAHIVDVRTLVGAGLRAAVAEPDAELSDFMVYEAGGGLLATPISELAAIATLPADFTDLRQDGGTTVGLMAHGSHTVPVSDLGALLGKPAIAAPAGCPVLLLRTTQGLMAFLVDRVLFMRQAAPQRVPHLALRTHGVAPAFTRTIVVEDADVDRAASVLSLDDLAARVPSASVSAVDAV